MSEYKQPREDIRGEVRDGGLLSLDDAALPARNLLVIVAHHLAGACLVGNPAPMVAGLSERIRNPQLGDLVYETSTLFRREHPGGNAFGYLVEHRREWWSTDQDWAQELVDDPSIGDEPRPVDTAWYVQYGPDPADICRWVNCEFHAIPDELRWVTEAPDSVITRDSIIGHLGDSGFKLRIP